MKTDVPLCDHCWRMAQFRFSRPGASPTLRCWRHAVLYGPVDRRALQVAAVAGTTLFAINQLNILLSGGLTPFVGLKIALTYLVPILVSTYSALAINQLHKNSLARDVAPPATPGTPA